MQFRALKLFVFVLVLCSASAGRYKSSPSRSTGGSSRGSGGVFRGGSYGGIGKPVSRPTYNPYSTSSGKTSSKDFLHSESGRPSLPASGPSRSSTPTQTHISTNYQKPSAPPLNHNAPSNYKPSSVVHDNHQQSNIGTSHSDPYSRQPATNPHIANTPYIPSGGYVPKPPNGVNLPTTYNNNNHHSSAPYPTGISNHPHPNTNIGSSSYPSNTHSQPPPYSINQPHNNIPVHGAPPPYNPHYQPPQYTQHAPVYHAPPPYQPASTPFVPGRTVYVVPESHKSSGPGIGSIIAGGVAGGVAAGATNAIVDHAISSIFRPSSHHIHTYPSAPPVGTPTSTVTHTTNNYYYGSGPGADNNAGAPSYNNNNNNNNQPQMVGQPAQLPNNNYNAQPTSGNSGVTTGGANDGRADPTMNSNGVVSRTQEGQPALADPNFISDEDIMKLTEELFDRQEKNLGQYIDELNLQKRVTNTGQETVPDEAPEPLFKIKSELYDNPTVKTLKALYDNYQRDGTIKENISDGRRNEEHAFLDEIAKTPVMTRALSWLVDRKLVESDKFEQKDLLRRTWFSSFANETSSGFERIFLSEKFGDSGIVGMQNWIYFAHLEAQNNVNYLGYVDQLNLSGKGLLLKLNYKTDGFTIQNAAIFVGTSPELEMALYTVCFHARPNNWCPVSLGGAKFFILTHSFRSYGKDLIDLGFPAF